MLPLFTLITIVLGTNAEPIATEILRKEPPIAQSIISYEEQGDKTKYIANDNALNFLTTSSGPYKIISVLGQARKGKSTTLNAIISTIIDHDVSPFTTSNGIDPCTQGIWMYILPKCACNAYNDQCGDNDPYCINSEYSYIFLDIEGSDTAKNEIALRYASIVTLLSSKIFLFIHESLYARDIDHINDIETFRGTMSRQNIDVPFDELDLGIIIREPLGNLVQGKLEEKINELFQTFSGINLNESSALLSSKLSVFAIDDVFNRKSYQKGIIQIVDFIKNEENYREITNKVQFGQLGAEKIIEFIYGIIEAMNENEDLNAVCIGCIFTKIIEWNDWGQWSECSEDCGGGVAERKRTCNTGRVLDCRKFRHGSAVHQKDCNKFDCELLKWSKWHPWSECDKRCGGGTQIRFRECGTGNNKDCEKASGETTSETRDCNTDPCGWNAWSECDKKCGGGTQIRSKECESRDDEYCKLTELTNRQNTQNRPCNTHSCYNVFYLLGLKI